MQIPIGGGGSCGVRVRFALSAIAPFLVDVCVFGWKLSVCGFCLFIGG